MPSRLTEDAVRKRLKAKHFKLVGRYTNNATPTEVICPECSRTFRATPAAIFANHTKSCGCLRRAASQRRQWTQREATKRLAEKGFVLLGRYSGSKAPTRVKCPMCGQPFDVRPNSVLTGGTRSCGCYHRQRTSACRKLSLTEAQRRFVERGFPPPRKYEGYVVPVDTKCPECGRRFQALPCKVFAGRTKRCDSCNRRLTSNRSRKNIVGLRHHFLVALHPTERRVRNSIVWAFACDCGRIVYYTLAELRPRKSCGCRWHRVGSDSAGWKGCGDMPRSVWAVIQCGARIRRLPVEISLEECWNLFVTQDGKCALSGVHLQFGSARQRVERTASLDRIDSNRGYTSENVQWVHKTVNKIKRNLTIERFVYLCGLVARPIRSKSPAPSCTINRQHGNFKGYGNVSRNYWRNVILGTTHGKYPSHRRKIRLGVSMKDAWEVFCRQGGRCALTGLELDFAVRLGGGKRQKKYRWGSASLDRIDSTKGYTAGNIQWVHKEVNFMKWELHEAEFKRFCGLIARNGAKAGELTGCVGMKTTARKG